MKVTEMTSSDLNTSTLTQSQRNLWEVGNVFASQAFLLAKVTAEQAASADVAQDSTFRYLMDNGDTPLNQRYTQVLDALIGRAKWNLHTMGVSALVFLAVEVGVVVPAAIWVLKARLTGVLAVRVRQIAFLVAVPRGVLVELARRSIELEDVEGVDDGETGAADREADKEVAMARDRMGEARLSSKAMRALLAQKLDYERVCGEFGSSGGVLVGWGGVGWGGVGRVGGASHHSERYAYCRSFICSLPFMRSLPLTHAKPATLVPTSPPYTHCHPRSPPIHSHCHP